MRRVLMLIGAGLLAGIEAVLRWTWDLFWWLALQPFAIGLMVAGVVVHLWSMGQRRVAPLLEVEESHDSTSAQADVVVLWPVGTPFPEPTLRGLAGSGAAIQRVFVAPMGHQDQPSGGLPSLEVAPEILPAARDASAALATAARHASARVLVVLEPEALVDGHRLQELLEQLRNPGVFAAMDPILRPQRVRNGREVLNRDRGVTVLRVPERGTQRRTPDQPRADLPSQGSDEGRGRSQWGIGQQVDWLPTASTWLSGCAFVRARWQWLGGVRAWAGVDDRDRALGLRAAHRSWSLLVRQDPRIPKAPESEAANAVSLSPAERWELSCSAVRSLPVFLHHTSGLPLAALRQLRRQPGPRGFTRWLCELGRIVVRAPATLRQRARLLQAQRPAEAAHWDPARLDDLAFARAHRRSPPGTVDTGLSLLVVTGRLPRRNVDGSWVVFARLRELARRHHLRVVSLAESPPAAEDLAALREFCEEVTLVPLPRRRPQNERHGLAPHRLGRDYGARELRGAVAAAIAAHPFDLAQVEYAEAAHVTFRLCAGVPSIHVVHEALSLHAARVVRHGLPGERAAARREAARWVRWERRVLPSFDRVVALSTADADWLERVAPGLRVAVVPSGIDVPPPAARAGLGDGHGGTGPVIAFAGNYQHPPNVDAALWLAREIFPLVRSSNPGASLWLLGREPTAEVAALAATSGIVVTGFVPDLAASLTAATVVAAPVRQGGGLRGKCLEAWALARPVVATTTACEGFAVKDGEHVLIADDASAFAAALSRCLVDAALCSRLGTRARELVLERYSVQAAARGFEDVYREVLEGRHGG